MFVSLIGSWIQTIAQSWLVFQLTNSAFLLGVVGFLSSIPIFLLSLFGGVTADRINKKSILIVTQVSFMLLAFLLAVLTHLRLITPSQIMLIALLNGVIMAFDAPSRQALVVELVGKKYLLNAIALNSAAFNSSRIIGPAMAGILIAGIGMSGCFYINGISFLAVIAALLFIRIEHTHKRNNSAGFIKDLFEGLVFIKDNKTVLALMGMVGISSLFGISYLILMPVVADNILKVGIKGLGVLMSSAGLGALLAALALAKMGDFRFKGRFLMLANFVFCASLILFSLSKIYLFSIIILVLLGWSSVSATALINTLLQQLSPDPVRGRVMSAYMFTFAGIMPFGNLLAGSLAASLGVSAAIMMAGIICAVFFILINLVYPKIRNI